MDSGYTVGTVGANDRQVRHANFALASLFDEAHTLNTPVVAREADANFIEESSVDLVDNLEMARQKYLKPLDRPFL
jgi:hypothetical protein